MNTQKDFELFLNDYENEPISLYGFEFSPAELFKNGAPDAYERLYQAWRELQTNSPGPLRLVQREQL